MYLFFKFFFLAIIRQVFACEEDLIKDESFSRGSFGELEDLWQAYPQDSHTRYSHMNRAFIESSTVTCSNISSVADIPRHFFTVPKSYPQFLNVTKSTLSILPPRAFEGIHIVTKLYLTHNHIKTIENGSFEGLSELLELYLDYNELFKLPNGVFNSLHKLRILSLSDNNINQIDKLAFEDLNELTNLVLRNNKLVTIEAGALELLENLTLLDLSGNPLKKIPALVPTLEIVELTRLSLTRFEVNLSNSSLVLVNLSSNLLTSVDFSKFEKVNYLDFSKNEIVSLTNLKNSNATHINLDGNKIEMIKESFSIFATELYLGHNRFKFLNRSLLYKSEFLGTLDFGFNEIFEIEKNTFLGLSFLDVLRLNNNKITKIDTGLFQDLKHLRILDLSHNQIEEFSFGIFDQLSSLSSLDISSNRIVNLNSHCFHSLKNLMELHLDNNQIASFDAEYFGSNLQLISLDHNHFSCSFLVNIAHIFQDRVLKIQNGESYDVENFHGIACVNRREFEEHHNLSTHLQRAITKGIETFFNKKQTTSYFKNLSSGNHVVMIIQLVVLCLLLVVISLIFVFLTKQTYRKYELSSQMELCPNL